MVLCDGKLIFGDADVLWGEKDPTRDLRLACNLSGDDLLLDIPKHWKRAWSSTYRFSRPHIKLFLPKTEWKKIKSEWERGLSLVEGEFPYFENHFCKHMNLLKSLARICVDEQKMREIYRNSNNDSIKSSIKSFWSGNEFCEPIQYSLIGTITGRMKVLTGPQIVTVRKDIKKSIVRSRFKGGKILGIDYRSIEPKFALWKAGKSVGESIYDDIKNEVFSGFEISSKCVKLFALAALYGSGPSKLAEATGIKIEDCRLYLQVVRNFFSVKKLSSGLQQERKDKKGIIFSHFGRAINTRDDKSHILFSNYNQSSTTTACLDGFCQMSHFVNKNNLNILPIAVIHDEIIWDCHPDFVKYMQDVASSGQILPSVGFEMTTKIEEF